MVYNPKTQQWIIREITGARGGSKWTSYIKKTALTLPPPDGVMNFFSGRRAKYGIGIIFNIHNCNLKDEKYVFANDAWTDCKWWIWGNSNKNLQDKKAVSINDLRQQNNRNRERGW